MKFLAADRSVAHDEFADALYNFAGRDAARHLFRVGASLDSMVVGEPQILGQLKLAYAQASEARSVGLVLHRAFHKAFSVAKRVRKGTLIGHGSVSVSSAAVALAGQIFDTLKDKTVMLMGAGKMAELTARQLSALGIESLLITSRTFDRAVALARELGGTAVPYDNYKPYLKMVDVLIGSVASTKPMLGPDEFEPVIRERRYRPMFLIDMGVPRNFDERLNALQNVYLYDIDDLGALVQRSLGDREREAEKAEQIVELELESFLKWLAGLDLTPTIKDIRYSVERLRDDELGRASRMAGATRAGRARARRNADPRADQQTASSDFVGAQAARRQNARRRVCRRSRAALAGRRVRRPGRRPRRRGRRRRRPGSRVTAHHADPSSTIVPLTAREGVRG